MGRRAPSSVIKDPNVMGGLPVVRGTRVPVHLILHMVRQGASEWEILDGYPSLDLEDIKVACTYAEGHPEEDY